MYAERSKTKDTVCRQREEEPGLQMQGYRGIHAEWEKWEKIKDVGDLLQIVSYMGKRMT